MSFNKSEPSEKDYQQKYIFPKKIVVNEPHNQNDFFI